ncbi:MAG TPA: CoA transferase subunit A [Myxococcales bacterium]|nr:CoA transferase subunit A [Myxococcales bacterium]HIN85187.1 CoA transferase subunit A [Myxococcales bacterium]
MNSSNAKIFENAELALHDVFDGAHIMSGGFGLCGNAENCIQELYRRGTRELTIISNNCGNAGQGLAVLLKKRQVARVIGSFIGGNQDLQEQMLAGDVEVELTPQGTMTERIRAGGAGLGGFFTPTGVGTVVAEGKEERVFNGKRYILEDPLTADFAIIRAHQGDPAGNLRFYGTARNFSPLMAMAAKTTIVEVDELVDLGALGPSDIHLPGIFVQRIFQGKDYQNPIEYRTTRPRPE